MIDTEAAELELPVDGCRKMKWCHSRHAADP